MKMFVNFPGANFCFALSRNRFWDSKLIVFANIVRKFAVSGRHATPYISTTTRQVVLKCRKKEFYIINILLNFISRLPINKDTSMHFGILNEGKWVFSCSDISIKA